jgi:hypothetical protein
MCQLAQVQISTHLNPIQSYGIFFSNAVQLSS